MNALTDPCSSAAAWALSEHRSFAELEPLREEWDRFVAACGATAYHSFDQCRIWWEHYGRGRRLLVFVVRADGAMVALLPMFVERRWLGPVWLDVAALVGSDSTLPVLELAARESAAEESVRLVLDRLLGSERCDVVRFAPLAGDAGAAAVRAATKALGSRARLVSDCVTGPYTLFCLPETFDAYLASIGKSQRSNYRRGMKQLREAHDVLLDVVSDPSELAREFPKFKALHDAQWASERKLGHFGDWPRGAAYHEDLVRAHAREGRAHLVRMSLGGRVVSYQLCYAIGRTLHWFLPARVLDPELERFSLGRLGLAQLVEFAIGAGYRRIDGGLGHYDYKVQLGGEERPVLSMLVASTRPGVATRVGVYVRLARLFHFLYYRTWFLKLAPRLPLPRRPLWRSWIRSRL